MKKILVAIALCVVICFCFTGCSKRQRDTDIIYNEFVVIEYLGKTDGTECYKVYSKETKIIYLYITNDKGNHVGATLSVYYGSDGLPMLYQ